jgi:ribose/xylose/arabinose/galactoside ABC-type transport system permease subunit
MGFQSNQQLQASTTIQDSFKKRVVDFRWENLFLFFAFLIMCGIFTALSPAFLTVQNILNVLRQSSVVFFLASGQTLALLSAGIDLSQGSIVSLVSVITADIMMRGYGFYSGVLGGIAVGTACGLFTGLWVGKARLNPFIATLGMNYIAAGIALLYTGGDSIFGLPKDCLSTMGWIGEGYFLKIPIPAIFAGINLAIMYLFLNRTKLGRYIYSVGGSQDAAVVSGINISRVKIWVYTLSGLLSAIGGVILTSRCISGQPILGGGTLLLESLGATVIGGTSLFGGEGGIFRTLLGVMIMSFGVNGLNLLATSTYMQDMIVGGIIIFSVWIGILRRKGM